MTRKKGEEHQSEANDRKAPQAQAKGLRKHKKKKGKERK